MVRDAQSTVVSRKDGGETRFSAREALVAIEQVAKTAQSRLRDRVLESDPLPSGERDLIGVTPASMPRVAARRLEELQPAAHALAHLAAELEAGRQLAAWADRAGGAFERRVADAYVGELVRSLRGGVDLGPCESIGLGELEIKDDEIAATLGHRGVAAWAAEVSSSKALCQLAQTALESGSFGAALPASGAEAGPLLRMREACRAFVTDDVAPLSQRVHQKDELLPLSVIEGLAAIGAFGLLVPVQHGGLGLGSLATTVVAEELSRGSLAVASLVTRAEIAAELILAGGTEAQRRELLPRIAAGTLLATPALTEPDHGSDLVHLRARADRIPGGGFTVRGEKSWATHASRADLLLLLLRTDATKPGHDGLSMFLAPKQRGSASDEFPDTGLTGHEVKALGFRGMKHFQLSFDGFSMPADALLGDREGLGFKHLMATFETSRIQTAARAVGVAQAALESAARRAQDRVQFGAPIASFPRVARKLGRMIAQVMAARQLTYAAARTKDAGARCDLEAGMAKLLATRVAWEAADACLQIHGGEGYADDSAASRLLVDARVLSLFEGTNEIQAQIVARRLLER